jgi:signal transduction histidine kinase
VTLPDYIEQNLDRLIEEWVEFARTRLPASEFMGTEALTNGSKELLQAIIADMKSPQTEEQRAAKGRGEGDRRKSTVGKTAREHAENRLQGGFTLDQVVSEYRALRASVIRRWMVDMGPPDQQMLGELIRFNEAMDQSLTEAVRWFNEELGRMRDTFIGVLGHDLRDPLSAALTANELQRLADGKPDIQRKANKTTDSNLQRMVAMVRDLLDFARTRLDGTLPVSHKDADMKTLCREIAEALELSHEGREVRLKFRGDLTGRWDTDRIKQVLSNLIKNALEHGDAASPVTVSAKGKEHEVVVAVHNEGTPIPIDEQHVIFDPFRHKPADDISSRRRPYSLGLGLYIVKQITEAHRGSVEIESTEESGTTFTVRLPRKPR